MKNPIFLFVTIPSVIAVSYFTSNFNSANNSKMKINSSEIINKDVVSQYAKEKVAASFVKNETSLVSLFPVTDTIKKANSITIDVLDTYERILKKDKHTSIDMLKKVANGRYYRDDFATAAEWYAVLFTKVPNPEREYHYRYGQALKAIGQKEKSEEQMKMFDNKKVVKE